jgi:hypothetical protein
MRAALVQHLRALPTPRIEFSSLHETLIIAGVATVLVIRTQLWLTHYPQLGGHGLHIAHLLWGGLFMLLAIGVLLTFIGKPVLRAAAVVGGVGFGFFIDELGKFVTEDNNYFYRPAAALIYLIFVGLFVLSRAVQRREGGRLSARSDVVNAVELLGEAARRRLDEPGRRRALALLRDADPAEPLVAPLRTLFRDLEVRPAAAPGRAAGVVAGAREAWTRLAAWPGFAACVSCLLGIWAAVSFAGVVELVTGAVVDLGGAHPGYVSDRLGDLAFVNVASLASSALSAALVAHGVLHLRRGARAAAYRSFERALLVAILVTQVFAFVESQFGAVFGLALDLVLLVALRTVQSNDPAAQAAAVPAPRAVARPLRPVSAGP